MRNNVITLLLILIFFNACGAQVSQETSISADSIESIDTAIEEEGFTLTTLDTNSQKIQKQSPSRITILYGPTQVLNIDTHSLYSITNETNQSIIVTIDNTLLDIIEDSPSFIIHHKLPLIPYGFTNLNTILTDGNSTITSILKEIEEAFSQKTLNNPSSKQIIYPVLDDLNTTDLVQLNENNTSTEEVTIQKTISSLSRQQVTYLVANDINVSYQTALKNQDETFECNGESKIIDAQKGYTILNNLPTGRVLCTFGINNIPMFDFNITQEDTTPPVITLNGESNITLAVGTEYIELGAIAMDNLDGNVSVIISSSINTLKVGIYLVNYSAKDKAGNVSQESREIKVTNTTTSPVEELPTEEEEE